VSTLTLARTATEIDVASNGTDGIDEHEIKFQFPRQGEWTHEHWLQFPDDGWKYEILDGVL